MTQTTADDVYANAVKPLSLSERLRLATMILNDIPPRAVADYSDEWSEGDLTDLRAASAAYLVGRLEAEEADGQSG